MFKVELTESYFPAMGGDTPEAMTIGDMLRASAAKLTDTPALKELNTEGGFDRVWTYSDLLRDSERLGRALASRHAEGARIAVYANNIPEWILLELGCALAGLTLVTVNPAYQKRELKFVLEQSKSEAIYYVADYRGNPMQQIADEVCDGIANIRHRILLTDHIALFAGEHDGELRSPSPRDPVQIQYTSGTTGFPKGALLHHNGLVRNAIETMARAGMQQGDVFVHYMPMFHTTGCGVLLLGGLSVGATMLLAPMFDPAVAVDVIEREKCDFILGVPTMLVALINVARQTKKDMSSVGRLMAGGAMVAPQLCRDAREVFGAPIQIVYGQTETSPVLTQAWYEDSDADLTETVGQASAYTELSIRDPKSNDVLPIGEQGEICARGYSVMLGYNDNPGATQQAIDSEGWLHTGDLGTMDARGYLKITGRVKEMIIRGGENIFPAEIENIMLEHPQIDEVAVVGVSDKFYGETIACFVRTNSGHKFTAAELKTYVRGQLSPQKTPNYWVQVSDWPLTGSGKIQKFKLSEAIEVGDYDILG